jgi:hypothetical protein
MLNRDRFLDLSIILWFGLFISQTAFSQVSPLAPLFPSAPEECQRFREQVNKFYSEVLVQHEQCLLNASKSSKPTPEPPNSLICSQPTCQLLHDYVYGNREKESRRQIDECQKTVQEKIDRAAREKAEADKREQEYQDNVRKRDAENAQRHEDYVRKRDAEKAERDAADAKTKADSANSSSGQSKSDQTPEQTPQQTQQVIVLPAYNQPTQRPQNTTVRNESSKPEASLVNPYAKAESAKVRNEGTIVDPYGREAASHSDEKLVDPYSTAARNESGSSEAYISSSKKAFEIAIETGEKKLAADIANAPNVLSGKRLEAYLEDARDTKGVMSGLGKMVKASEYATDVAAILKSNNDEERLGAGAHLGLTFAEDVGKKGISTVATKLFPEAAVVLSGPVGWVAFVGQQVLVPSEISREPTEIIRDNSGHTSLPQKQEALFQMWKQYDKFGANWKEPQKRELLQNTQIVYEQAGAK